MKTNFYCSWLIKFVAWLFTFSSIITAGGQTNIIATATGQPSLSKEMTDQYRTIYEFLLEIKLSSQQKIRLQKGLAQYWTQDNTEAIAQTITDLKYYGKTDELESLRGSSSQKLFDRGSGENFIFAAGNKFQDGKSLFLHKAE